MSKHAARACRSVWERRGLRWLAAAGVAVSLVLIVAVATTASGVAACLPTAPTLITAGVVSPNGSGAVGTPVSTTDGSWTTSCGLANYGTYQWFRGATAINNSGGNPYLSGTTNPYVSQTADAGSTLTVQVTECNSEGCSSPATSTGSFTPTAGGLGANDYWPIWSHGPVDVNEANGNLVVSLPTPSVPTATGALGFSLSYNSQSGADGSYGLATGWTLSAGDVSPPSQLINHWHRPYPFSGAEIDWPDGSIEMYFKVGASDLYLPQASDNSSVVQNSDGTWTLSASDGTLYGFGTESSGISMLQKVVTVPATGSGLVTDTFVNGKLSTVSYPDSAPDGESLGFSWNCTIGSTSYYLCVTTPDGREWGYSADANGNITGVWDGTRQVMALSWNSSHQLTAIQNADDLDPSHASPGYNSSHTLALTYDSSSPAKVTCVIDGPISDQPATSQPTCAGGGTASKSTWSFSYPSLASCPTLQTPANSHAVAEGTVVGCATVTNPNQQPSGPGITVLYDSGARPLEYDDARLGSSSHRISLVQYNDQNQVAWTEDVDGNPTDYAYDPLTNVLLSVTGPSPDGSAPRPVTHYRYDEQTMGTATTAGSALTGLAGSYWSNDTLSWEPALQQTDPGSGTTFNFLASGGGWPPTGIGSPFSVRWTGELTVPSCSACDGDHIIFSTTSLAGTDSTRLLIDGNDLIENWTAKASPATASVIYLEPGSTHLITLEYAHHSSTKSTAQVKLRWKCSDCSPAISSAQAITVSNLAPAWGNQTSVVSPSGRISFQHYLSPATHQPDYSLVKVGSSNLITSFVYDSLGRMTKQYMPKANANATINSSTGNLTWTGGASPDTNYETDYTYYADGDTAAPPSACGGGTAVDQFQQLEQTSIPNGGVHSTVLVYNSAGDLAASTDGKGTSCLSYDAEGRLTSQTPNGDQSHPITYAYDPNGTQLTASNSAGTVTTYYDEAGRQLDTTDASGAEAHFCYDADSNTTSRAANTTALGSTSCPLSTNYTTSYTYDAADELTGETDPASNSWSFFYDHRGNLRGTQNPNGTFSWTDTSPAGDTSDVYNRHGTITSTTTTAPSDSNPIADYTYTYLDGSNVYQDGKKLSEVRISGSTSQTTNYTYDAVGRLSQVLLPSGTCRKYSFDLDSNRTQSQQSSTGCGGTFTTTATYAYNPSTTPGTDELTSISASSTTNYGYTSDGQVSSQGSTGYTWDGFGRIATATVGSNTVTYTYDPADALMTRATSSPSTTTNYVLGDLFETNGSGTITTSYIDGPAGNLARYNGPPTSSSTPTYLYYDDHGNLAAEANSSGSQTANHTYDPFGTPLDSVPSNTTIHRFTGSWDKQYDTTTSLILMGARPYDPTTGRFLAVDPIPGGSLNNYDYADQDPINNYDLSGTMMCSACGGGVGGTGGAIFINPSTGAIFLGGAVLWVHGEKVTGAIRGLITHLMQVLQARKGKQNLIPTGVGVQTEEELKALVASGKITDAQAKQIAKQKGWRRSRFRKGGSKR